MSSDGCPALEKQFSIVTGRSCGKGGGGWGVRVGYWPPHCVWWWWGCEGCAFPHLPWGSWELQLFASGRPGGSLLEALVASREEDPGTPRKAVVSFWEAGDV